MTTDIKELFQKYESEIVKISPEDKEAILKQAESFVHEKFSAELALDGGHLSGINSAMARSLLELFVRAKASASSIGPIPKIDLETYKIALEAFEEFVGKKFDSYDLLLGYWLSQVKIYVSNIFTSSEKAFKTYIIGDLCENLYLDNRLAEGVIQELKREGFIKVVGKQYGQEIFVRKY